MRFVLTRVQDLVERERLVSQQTTLVCPHCKRARPLRVYRLHVEHCLRNPKRPDP